MDRTVQSLSTIRKKVEYKNLVEQERVLYPNGTMPDWLKAARVCEMPESDIQKSTELLVHSAQAEGLSGASATLFHAQKTRESLEEMAIVPTLLAGQENHS